MKERKKENFLKRLFITQTHGYLNVFPKRELWRQISKEFNGDFKVGHNSGNELEILKISIPYGKYEIQLSESDTRPLKFQVEFYSLQEFELVIGGEDSIEHILKKLGKKEIEIGNEEFDSKYLIQSKSIEKTRGFFSKEIIDYFLRYNIYSMSYITNSKKQRSKLTTVISRTINKKEVINDLIICHEKIIDKLKEQRIVK